MNAVRVTARRARKINIYEDVPAKNLKLPVLSNDMIWLYAVSFKIEQTGIKTICDCRIKSCNFELWKCISKKSILSSYWKLFIYHIISYKINMIVLEMEKSSSINIWYCAVNCVLLTACLLSYITLIYSHNVVCFIN